MFTIPNEADAAFAAQAAPDKVDVDVLVAAHEGTGVVGGCAVTAQGSPDMTLAVASGTVSVLGVQAAVTAGNVTITTAHATNPRFDLVVVSSAGVKSVTAGTAGASPVFPAIPASSVVLAAVYVPANDTAIGSTQIVDKRVPTIRYGSLIGLVQYTPAADIDVSTTAAGGSDINAANLTFTLTVPASGRIFYEFTASINKITASDWAWWLLRTDSGAITASEQPVAFNSTGAVVMRGTFTYLETGLTPGATIIRRFGCRNTSGALRHYANPITMKATAA